MTYGQAKKDFEIKILYVKDAKDNYKQVEWLPDDAEGKIGIAMQHWIGIKSLSAFCFVVDIAPKVD